MAFALRVSPSHIGQFDMPVEGPKKRQKVLDNRSTDYADDMPVGQEFAIFPPAFTAVHGQAPGAGLEVAVPMDYMMGHLSADAHYAGYQVCVLTGAPQAHEDSNLACMFFVHFAGPRRGTRPTCRR